MLEPLAIQASLGDKNLLRHKMNAYLGTNL